MDAQIPTEPPVAGNEIDTLLGSLERQRRTFAWKAAGLDRAGLTARVGASTMTLGGLLKHLAWVEDDYANTRVWSRPSHEPWQGAKFDVDPDWAWNSAADDSPADLYELWEGAVSRSRSAIAAALSDGGLDRPAGFTWPDGRSPSLRRLMIDLVEEYARHTGHADILREAVDGRVGEDAPDSW